MLRGLAPQAADPILELVALFREDPRAGKIDLGVGVYRTADGRTPVMGAVKAAEARIWEAQESKIYTALAGDPAFAEAMRALVLGASVPASRIAAAAAPGGTGALHLAFDLFRLAAPEGRLWLPRPSWPNHAAIADQLGMARREYRYFDAAGGGLDGAGMLADLAAARRDDLVLLHGCCHNPTGADPTAAEWQAIAGCLDKTGATPLIDLAYQGFGDGVAADAAPVRAVLSRLPQGLVAASCSKSFGLYRERAGVLLAACPDAATRSRTQDALAALNRTAYSFPPDHGARVVTSILGDPALRAGWQAELDAMRARLTEMRAALVEALRQRSNSDRFDVLARHRGMFSRLGAGPAQVAALRRDHGIYLVGDGRMNLSGLNAGSVPVLADAIVAAGL